MTYLLLHCIAEDIQLTPEERATMPGAAESWVAGSFELRLFARG